MNSTGTPPAHPILVLEPINSGFALKSFELSEQTRIKIGRQTGINTAPSPTNGYFDSKVLSRVHAEVWADSGKVYIRDLKSSNGTFLNGRRLSAENVESEPFVLNQNDSLEFGIDIMDDNGSLLHEKVACRIYISRLSSYPTPGGSPQDSHAKLKSGSPPGSGNSYKTTTATTAATAGQSANIDLIISRLQSELTRSQEANANLGILKQGLGDLEKSIVVSAKEESSIPSPKSPAASTQDAAAANYEKILEENTQAHKEEIARLTKSLEETQAELQAYIQKTQLLEPLVAEDEILRRDIAQNIAELSKVRLERDLAKDSINDMINEHQYTLDTLRKEQEASLEAMRKEHEAALAALETTHKHNMDRLTREASLSQDALTLKFQEDLALALRSVPEPLPANPEPAQIVDTSALEKEIVLLQETVEKQTKQIQKLQAENMAVNQALTDAKTEIIKTTKDLKESLDRERHREELASLTPILPVKSSTASLDQLQNGQEPSSGTTISTLTTTQGNRHEFRWSQLVFSSGKKSQHPLSQPSTVLMSSGVMLVGIGAYVFLRKSN
ncbi:hypothetical protein FBU30_007828 [Linnemannia zychae]|nr:hypothetical protein FBU30_007828 [Linnemannia zychae]